MARLTDADIVEIRALRDPWIQACLTRDWNALFSLCTPDITLFPPDAPIAEGFETAWEYMDGFPVMKAFAFEFAGIDGREDLATAYGRYEIVAEMDGGDVTLRGKFVDRFRKSEDGRWHFDQVIWNHDHPLG